MVPRPRALAVSLANDLAKKNLIGLNMGATNLAALLPAQASIAAAQAI